MSDPIGDAARDPVGGPAAAGTGATGGSVNAAAPSTAVVVGPVGLSAEAGVASVVCPLLELARDGGSGRPSLDAGAATPDEAEPGAGEVAMRPDPGNRCAASSPPAPISTSQQRFVCFDAGHVDCPRFVRAMASSRSGGVRAGRAAAVQSAGAATAATVAGAASIAAAAAAGAGSTGAQSPAGGESGSPQESVSPAAPEAGQAAETPIPPLVGVTASAGSPASGAAAGASAGVASIASDGPAATPVTPVTPVTRSSRRSGARPAGRPTPTVVAAVILLVALGLTVAFVSIRGGLALPGASPSPVAVASPSPSATVLESPSPSVAVTPSAIPSPSPILSPSPVISPTPAPTPAPSLPAAYQGLKPCTDRPDCYLYRVRSGDNLSAIAGRFGITLAALKAANPEITDPSLLHVGDVIRVPLPRN